MKEKITSHIIKGAIISALLILLNLTGLLTKWVYLSWSGWIEIIVFLVGIMMATFYYGKQMNNQVTFGQLFTHGFKTTAVVICLVFIYSWISIYFLFPGFVETKMRPGLIQARLQGKTDLEIKQYLAIGKKVFLAGNLMLNLITGAAGSLLGSLITNKSVAYNLTTINK
jgi:hypothetical protein